MAHFHTHIYCAFFSFSRPLYNDDEGVLEEEENSNNRTIMEDEELEQRGNGGSILPPVLLPLRNHNSTEAILTSMTSLPSPKISSSAHHSESNSQQKVQFFLGKQQCVCLKG